MWNIGIGSFRSTRGCLGLSLDSYYLTWPERSLLFFHIAFYIHLVLSVTNSVYFMFVRLESCLHWYRSGAHYVLTIVTYPNSLTVSGLWLLYHPLCHGNIFLYCVACFQTALPGFDFPILDVQIVQSQVKCPVGHFNSVQLFIKALNSFISFF